MTVAAFHQTNHDRFRLWPQSMLNTSTHDSKRSEDVRARLNVLSEMAPEWQQRVNRWSKQNRSLKVQLGQIVAPTKNDEYAFYQNLLGAWPIPPVTEEDRLNFIQRMKTMMLKTSREAKVHTSWINPNAPYEEALSGFVDKCLNETQKPFLNDFLAFQQNLAWFGMLNSLSQLFLKLVAPGIPDIYQGNEIWRFCLADPDNRRPVDFHKRQDFLLPMLEQIDAENSDRLALQQELLANLHDGRAKMYTIAQTLRLRNSWPDVFSGGAYQPIEITGSKSDHLCAFSRTQNKRAVLALAPRLYLTMMRGETALPLGDSVWHDTAIKLPADLDGFQFRNVFSPEPVPGGESDKNQPALRAGGLLQFWPVALLKGSTRTA
jgi:(1->4)-alpha-D-glucan 1-alpha-D-glucosylmutase